MPALPETTEFLAALNAAPVLMWLSDAHHSAVYFNQAWLDYTGRSLVQELGDGWQRGVHPDDLSGYHAVMAVSDQTATVVAEYRLRDRHGNWRWMQHTGRPRILAGGDMAGYIGTCVDVTDRRLAEDAARDSATRLNDIAENFPGVIFRRISHPDGRIEYPYFSGNGDKLFNIPSDKISGPMTMDYISEMIHDDDFADVVARFEHAAETLTTYEGEGRLIGDDGSVRWVRSVSKPRRAETGELVWDGFIIDATDHHRHGAERERVAAMLNLSMNVAGIGTWEHDHDSQMVTGSSFTNQLFGLPQTDDPRPWDDYVAAIHPADRANLATRFDTGRQGAETSAEFRVMGRDGTRWVASRGTTRRLADGSERTFGAVFDITDRKMLENQQRQALRTQTRLLKELNHRVKNNFQIILSILRLRDDTGNGTLCAIERVEAISALHAQLSLDGAAGQADFGHFISDFCAKVAATALERRALVMRCTAVECTLDLDQAVPLALIVNEILMARVGLEQGAEGEILLDLVSADQGRVLIILRDHLGPGPLATSQSGLRLIEGLRRQIGADIRVVQTPDGATEHSITLGEGARDDG